jgi:hypothetical protein
MKQAVTSVAGWRQQFRRGDNNDQGVVKRHVGVALWQRRWQEKAVRKLLAWRRITKVKKRENEMAREESEEK